MCKDDDKIIRGTNRNFALFWGIRRQIIECCVSVPVSSKKKLECSNLEFRSTPNVSRRETPTSSVITCSGPSTATKTASSTSRSSFSPSTSRPAAAQRRSSTGPSGNRRSSCQGQAVSQHCFPSGNKHSSLQVTSIASLQVITHYDCQVTIILPAGSQHCFPSDNKHSSLQVASTLPFQIASIPLQITSILPFR